jgi:ornithine carbamoyltransferase
MAHNATRPDGPRHFLSLLDLSPTELRTLIARASELKRATHAGEIYEPLKNRVLGMIFEKSSTRTRVSFETGMIQLGGAALFLSPRDTQLGRGEPIEDTARVLSRMVDCVMIRTFEHDKIERFAAHSQVPVINGLTDLVHPCQLLADMQTYAEHRGDISGKTVTWVGDGNNMCHSYINAARQFDFQLRIACPEGYDPDPALLASAGERCTLLRDPMAAAEGADLLVTDVWASMGQEEEQTKRNHDFTGFMVDAAMMANANPDALFFHCLPAHRGEEVAAEVIDRPDSVVWDEAENRLHAQKALLEFLLVGNPTG